MVNWHWRLGWLISLLWLPVAAAEPDTAPPASLAELSYLTEQYKPYNYQAAGELPAGLAVELLHRIWRQTGTAEQPIQVLPWPRAYNQLNVQPDTVLFSTARTKEREPLFKWACPIARSPIVLIALKESRIRLSSLQDASRYRIAAILDDVGRSLNCRRGCVRLAACFSFAPVRGWSERGVACAYRSVVRIGWG